MTDNRFKELIAADKDMMTILTIIASLPLRDAWLAAGAIRNFIWNQLAYGIGFDADTDIDVVFFDPSLPYEANQIVEDFLNKKFPNYRWEVRNQAYMHSHCPNTEPYLSTCDAISQRVMPFQSTPSDAQLLLLGGLMTSWNCLPLMG